MQCELSQFKKFKIIFPNRIKSIVEIQSTFCDRINDRQFEDRCFHLYVSIVDRDNVNPWLSRSFTHSINRRKGTMSDAGKRSTTLKRLTRFCGEW